MKSEGKQIILSAEIETRARLRTEFDRLLADLAGGGITVTGPADMNALAELLFGITEERKRLEREEKALRAELRRHFPEGLDVLPLESFLVFIERSQRSYLDKEKIEGEFGPDFVTKYSYVTPIESLKIKRIGGGK